MVYFERNLCGGARLAFIKMHEGLQDQGRTRGLKDWSVMRILAVGEDADGSRARCVVQTTGKGKKRMS